MNDLAAAGNSEDVALGPREPVCPMSALARSPNDIVDSGRGAQTDAQSPAAAAMQVAREQQWRRSWHWRGEPIRYVKRDRAARRNRGRRDQQVRSIRSDCRAKSKGLAPQGQEYSPDTHTIYRIFPAASGLRLISCWLPTGIGPKAFHGSGAALCQRAEASLI
jgi:hypothetical protein